MLLSGTPVVNLWGNRDWSGLLERGLPDLPPVGELWLNDDRQGGSKVVEGPLAGMGLKELISLAPKEILGPVWAPAGRFPILIKFLNPAQWLSIQVHPQEGLSGGKTEAWHILRAEPGARLIVGLKAGLGRSDLVRAADQGQWPDILNYHPVQAGQTLFISPGQVHSIGPGLLLFEIQQNNDITYRLYDWDRLAPDGLPRPLHLAQAQAAVRYDLAPAGPVKTQTLDCLGGQRTYLTACRHFLLCRLELEAVFKGRTQGRRFFLLTVLQGRGQVAGGGGRFDLKKGDTVLVPAGLGDFQVRPQKRLVLLESSAPDLVEEVVSPLKAAGLSDQAILGLAQEQGAQELGLARKAWARG